MVLLSLAVEVFTEVCMCRCRLQWISQHVISARVLAEHCCSTVREVYESCIVVLSCSKNMRPGAATMMQYQTSGMNIGYMYLVFLAAVFLQDDFFPTSKTFTEKLFHGVQQSVIFSYISLRTSNLAHASFGICCVHPKFHMTQFV